MSKVFAVLLDTISIQQYIFSSNQLRENLGASHLVKQIYDGLLANALAQVTGKPAKQIDLNRWRGGANALQFDNGYDIGFVGGGNALLFFESEEVAKSFIESWTTSLLIQTPGLVPAIALEAVDKDDNNVLSYFKQTMDRLFAGLDRNKNNYRPMTSLPRHGITAECSRSMASAEVYDNVTRGYVSSGTMAKIDAAGDSREDVEKLFVEELQGRYCFPNELENLGNVKGSDSHIAIVNIDGNQMGDRFKKIDSLGETRNLSHSIYLANVAPFKTLIHLIVSNYGKIMSSLGIEEKNYPYEHGKYYLPIRPIILGGDDITFVCEGRLGIYFAKHFIENLEQNVLSDGKHLFACAGVAIIKTKYPFYRGVKLAESLLKNAKVAAYKVENTSYLDFHISLGGLAGSLEHIRETQFEGPQGSLLFRPFSIQAQSVSPEKELNAFLEQAFELKYGKNKLPNNRINDLSRVIGLGKEETSKFCEDLKYRGKQLPTIQGRQFDTTLYENKETPYFDMTELIHFYPEFALRKSSHDVSA